MQKENYVPFVVTDGDVLNGIIAFETANNDANAAHWAFANRFGATKIYRDNAMRGLVFALDAVPEGWVNLKKLPSGVYVPRANTKLRHEFDDLPRLHGFERFGHYINCEDVIIGNRIYWPKFERVGDQCIVWIPKLRIDAGYTFPGTENGTSGARQIMISEYYTMVESAEGGVTRP